VRAVCKALSKPVNFLVGITGKSFSVVELATAGVKRISLVASLYQAAITRLLEASKMKNSGQFDFVDYCVSTADLLKLMRI
jgi:2-methylisocitrate lyase-like PEP mutase family enzyme